MNPPAVRFERAPSPQLQALFSAGGLLEPLLRPLTASGLALDLQFREGDAFQLYCGQTSLIRGRLTSTGVALDAHKTYRQQAPATALLRTWEENESGFAEALDRYLAQVVVSTRWTGKEGQVQARWMHQRTPWVPIDREAVLGYADEAARESALDNKSVHAGIAEVQSLCAAEGWKAPSTRIASNEVDQLAIDPKGRVVLVELKHGRGSDAYHAPLQVLRYAHEWSTALATIMPDLERLIAARQSLAMTPDNLPEVRSELRLVIAFGQVHPSAEVLCRLRRIVSEVEPYLPSGAAIIEIWSLCRAGSTQTL